MFSIQALLFGLATFGCTFLGGQIALRYKRFMNPLIAFCGGTLIAAALLDLIPEAHELLKNLDIVYVLGGVLASFMWFHFLDKLISIHGHSHSEECEEHEHDRKKFGLFAASGLIIHSFMDGLAIGAGFLINPAVGILIGSVVLMHDFADGMNTVTLLLRNDHEKRTAKIFLIADALVPVLGVATTGFLKPSATVLGGILIFFAGFFLYLGASDLLPEAHRDRSSVKLVGFTVLGVIVVTLFRLIVGGA
jgi:ZIP family zinc transporter